MTPFPATGNLVGKRHIGGLFENACAFDRHVSACPETSRANDRPPTKTCHAGTGRVPPPKERG